ncbi:nucleotidyltransferase family protein [Cryobacterium adonitolivorans]|uniref:Nucleotidyltransferase family protein n=1 Tax=Cryobacterium adonitolivorans TaxID=1259189 RepID=A0A4R8WCP9_9MICO|nr:nucleotidyltransferase family protein [Cryobacterium adonitolivorans]TFC07073.1 nucleotidyltransferase family protein [Cryobacterium adonitolivorans]
MHSRDAPRVAGLVLAAGAGSRYGLPKALVVDASGEPWLVHAALALEAGGCDPVLVVLGAGGAPAESLLRAAAGRFRRPDRLWVVHAENWAEGLSASLDAGLARLQQTEDDTVTAVALVPVDVPDLDAATVRRLVDAVTPHTLRQAHFGGRPGHPVVIGREHWAPLRASLTGDTGARAYLVARDATAVACDDLGTGLDVDLPPLE